MRVRSGDAQPYFYPDLSALCGTPTFADGEFDVLLNPSPIVEILSDSTQAYDRGEKFARRRTVTSLREYVLAAQREMRVDRFVRGEGGAWVLTAPDGPDAVLALASVGCAVPLAKLYEGVEPTPHPRRLREPAPRACAPSHAGGTA